MASPEIIYCAGKNRRYEAIARAAGWTLGARLPATVYHPLGFADQDWRDPDRAAYMRALARHRPAMATVLDLERPEQRGAVLDWAEEAAQYVERIVIIPKYSGAVDALPRRVGGADVILGYSVPTSHGGTDVPIWEFCGWPVHLLGGSPHAQMHIARYVDVMSVDCNMHQERAHHCQFWSARKGEKGHWWQLRDIGISLPADNTLEAFRRSCEAIIAAWAALAASVEEGDGL